MLNKAPKEEFRNIARLVEMVLGKPKLARLQGTSRATNTVLLLCNSQKTEQGKCRTVANQWEHKSKAEVAYASMPLLQSSVWRYLTTVLGKESMSSSEESLLFKEFVNPYLIIHLHLMG